MPDWWEKLWPLLVDKVLLGLIGGYLGFFLARRLERFRRYQTGIGELVKARIAAVSEVHAALFAFEDALGFEEAQWIGGVDSRQLPPPPEESGDLLYARASRAIARHRFLLGHEFHRTAAAHLQAMQEARSELPNVREQTWTRVKATFEAWERATPSEAILPPDEMPKLPQRGRAGRSEE